ncbi:MAG: endopeptidase La [Bacteroidales bacterium]|nr:endopeptidase La [Bacteroidales bacterium]
MDDNCQIVSFGRFDIGNNGKGADPTWSDLPVIATRNLVLFPQVTIPIALVRENALRVARYASEHNIAVGICCQLDASQNQITDVSQIYRYGVVAEVIQVLDLPDGTHTALVRARGRFKIKKSSPGLTIPDSEINVVATPVSDRRPAEGDKEFEVLRKSIIDGIKKLSKGLDGGTGIFINFENISDGAELINTVATNLPFEPAEKMEMLAKQRIKERGMMLYQAMLEIMSRIEIANSIKEKAQMEMTQQNRNAFLQHQMNAIREELYGDENDEIDGLRKKVSEVSLPENVARTIDKEIDRLQRLNPSMPDYATLLSYIETVLDLPWNVETDLNTDFATAEATLNADHFGLEKVKDRILEQLAVMINNPKGRSPIICLVGAPGVGKTSLGQSIAKALGRNYSRVSLGGLHDEAEIRGHRRTYIGAMPGRIMDSIRRAKSNNPVILLDEVDKIGNDFKGDPSAALLEVLDPEQNCRFHDNYIDVDFDLSKVLFIATANTLSTLSQPLLDRMEIIEISGYLVEEKIEIARRHLLPRVMKALNIDPESVTFSEAALRKIIEEYTSESGVRQLEKAIAGVLRKTLLRRMQKKEVPAEIQPEHLRDYLGLPRHQSDRYEGNDFPGVVTGLAWTAVGGEILFIESSLSKGKGEKLTLTGNLGDVMKESAVIALQYVKAHASEIGIEPEKFDTYNLHIHVPEGAIPKDGPSAGITMATSIVSAFTGKRVRDRIAMTGEITLRGKVLPVGGIKEKILAAKRAGIVDIILSAENQRDVEDINERYVRGLNFHYVDTVLDVIRYAIPD